MLEGEEELVVSDEDFSMTSEPEDEKPPNLAQLILQNAKIQLEIQAKRDLQKLENSIPERITKLPSHSHLKHSLKLLWKNRARLLTLSHALYDCDCSGDQDVELKLVNDFNDRRATYLANEAKLKLKAEKAKAKAAAKAAALKKKRRNSDSDDSDFDSDDDDSHEDDSNEEDSNNTSNGNNSDDDGSIASGETSAGARTDRTNHSSTSSTENKEGETHGEGEEEGKEEEGKEEEHRDSDDDIEPPPDIPAITSAFVNTIIMGKTKLEGIQMDENPLGPPGTANLCQALTTLPNLTMLNLSATNAGTEGARSLADAIRGSNLQRTLLHVVFGYNGIGSDGAAYIVEAVGRRCRSLETLRLHNNNITSDGGQTIATELLQCKSLRVLDLGGNKIGDRGIEMIAEYIGENKALKRISLQDNSFTKRGAQALVRTLRLINQFPTHERIQGMSVAQCHRLTDAIKIELQDAARCLPDFRLTV